MRTHLGGKGARLVRQALAAGIGIELVRVWPNANKKDEYRLKRKGPPKRYCPRCSPPP